MRAAFLWACAQDVAVAKPGNVSWTSDGHGMQAQMFIDSAHACVDAVCAPGMRVGERIERAVTATWAVAGCNTNLGIILLCAPLAAALEIIPAMPGTPDETCKLWRSSLQSRLLALNIDDARAAYRGIAAANPGGLGKVQTQSVLDGPTVTLLDAMQLAADRDSIARQYVCGFADLFAQLLPLFESNWGRGSNIEQAVLAVYMAALSTWLDSHIVRKQGLALAQTVTNRASLLAASDRFDSVALSQWDAELKHARVNPGTSADLTVATLFIAACLSQDLPELVTPTPPFSA
jgi:triphosphoribosyl-dephospho-CoA synthase